MRDFISKEHRGFTGWSIKGLEGITETEATEENVNNVFATL